MDDRLLTVFPDTNVLIQGRSLAELPWHELGHSSVEIIICGPVIRELDRLKNKGGRPGRVARAMSTTVRELMDRPDNADVLKEANPRVVRRLLLGSSIKKPVRNGLDLGNDDQAIMNQAFARMDAGDHVLLLTDDNYAAMTAKEFGLPTRMLPADWLKPPEKDDSAKEITRRDAEIARLKAASPVPQLRFANKAGEKIERLEATLRRYLPLDEADVSRLMSQVEAAAPVDRKDPLQQQAIHNLGLPALGLSNLYVPVRPADIEAYVAEHRAWLVKVRHMLRTLHDVRNRGREWPELQLLASNVGTRPASDVLVEIEVNGSFQVSGGYREARQSSLTTLPLPPEPPRPRHRYEDLIRGIPINEHSPLTRANPLDALIKSKRTDDVFYWRNGQENPAEVLALECKSWRHGRQEDDFPFGVFGSDARDINGRVLGRIHASNLSEAVEVSLPVRIRFEERESVTMADGLVADLLARISRPNKRPKDG